MTETNFTYGNVQKYLVQALFHEQSIIPKVSSFVSIDDFIDENYKIIYSALLSLNNNSEEEKIQLSEIYNWVIENNHVVNPEVWINLSKPTDESPSVLAEILKRLSAQNKAKIYLTESANMLSTDTSNTLEILSETSTNLNNLASTLIVKKDEKTLQENLDELYEYVIQEQEEEIDTIPLYNKCMSDVLNQGWRQEQMIVIGARTGVGKSVFAVDSTVAACNSDRSVLFFSLEMSKKEVYQRLLSVQSDVILNKLKPGKEKTEEEKNRIKEAVDQMKEWKLEIDDQPGQTVETIKAKAKLKAMSPEGLDMIIIDYLQLIKPSNSYGKNRQDQVAEISREIKILAKTLKVPVMVLVQLKRANKTKEETEDELPTLDEIRESGAIAQDADVVILIHRKKKEDDADPKATFIIDKNRAGSAPRIFKVRCVLEKSAFRDLSPDEEDEEENENENLSEILTEKKEINFFADENSSSETINIFDDSLKNTSSFDTSLDSNDEALWDELFKDI